MTERYLLLGRLDCHLCEDFEQALREHLGAADYTLDRACVDDRAEWRLRYGPRIPVLLNEAGTALSEGRFDAMAFERARLPELR